MASLRCARCMPGSTCGRRGTRHGAGFGNASYFFEGRGHRMASLRCARCMLGSTCGRRGTRHGAGGEGMEWRRCAVHAACSAAPAGGVAHVTAQGLGMPPIFLRGEGIEWPRCAVHAACPAAPAGGMAHVTAQGLGMPHMFLRGGALNGVAALCMLHARQHLGQAWLHVARA
eukprot:365742-Chlamydomonas_euryale.AAC.20